MKQGKPKLSPVEKELRKIAQEEEKLSQNAFRQAASPGWKTKLEEKNPPEYISGSPESIFKSILYYF